MSISGAIYNLARCEETFVRYFLGQSASRRAMIREKLDILERDIASTRDLIEDPFLAWRRKKKRKMQGELKTKLIQLTGQKATLSNILDSLGERKLRAQYRRILEIPRIQSVEISRDTLVIRAETLFGKDLLGGWHLIGAMQIEIDLWAKAPSAIRWKNLTHVIQNMQGPPNISLHGLVGCLGDALAPLERAFAEEDWETLVAIVVRYPECAGSRNQIQIWPIVPVEEVPLWYIETFGAEVSPVIGVNMFGDYHM